MSDFKAGDRVTVTKRSSRLYGSEGTVIGVPGSEVRVRFVIKLSDVPYRAFLLANGLGSRRVRTHSFKPGDLWLHPKRATSTSSP